MTLRVRGAIAGRGTARFIADTHSRWDDLSFEDVDGTRYKTDVRLTEAIGDIKPAIQIEWGERSEDRANADLGIVRFDLTEGIKPGVPAHEFGHAMLGIADAYRGIKIDGYYLPALPYHGFEDSLMADSARGMVRLQDLKAIISAYENPK